MPCTIWNRKLVIFSGFSLLVLIGAAILFHFSTETLFSTVSPDRSHRVEIFQRRFTFPVNERYVYLKAFSNDKPVVKHKLLYTGDFLDEDFMELYPNPSWQSNVVLQMGRTAASNDGPSRLTITNETTNDISYLLVETYEEKFVLFDMQPEAATKLSFRYVGRLSCQGEYAGSHKRFGGAAEVAGARGEPVTGQFSIRIKADDVIIESSEVELKRVTCCAVDRPDYHHE